MEPEDEETTTQHAAEHGPYRLLVEAVRLDAQAGAVLGSAPVGVCFLDEEGTFAQVNDAYATLPGYRLHELLGLPFTVILPPETLEKGQDTFRRAMASGAPYVSESAVRRRDGTRVTVLVASIPVVVPDGHPQLATFVVDIEERRRAEEALGRLAAIVTSTSDAIISLTFDRTVTSWNPGAERLYGYTAAEAIGRSIDLVAVPGGPHEEQQIREALLRGEAVVSLETQRRHRDGRVLDVSISVSPITDARGVVIGAAGIHRDISLRKAMEEELRASEARFRALTEIGNDLVRVMDTDGTIRYASASHRRVLGYDPAEVLGRTSFDFLHPDDVEQAQAALAALVAESGTRQLTTRRRHADGTYRTFETILHNRLDDPRLHGIVVNERDITERLALEAARRESDAAYRRFFDGAAIGMSMISLEDRYVRVNAALCRMLGYSEEELAGSPVERITLPEDRPLSRAHIDRVRAGSARSAKFEQRYRHKDGHTVWAHITITLVRGEDGRPAYFTNQLVDITERKRAEEALARANAELARANAEWETLLRVLPVGIGVADDPAVSRIRMNPAFARMVDLPLGSNVSLGAPEGERPTTFRVYRDGRELAAEELPMQVAAATGREVPGVELEVLRDDGVRITELVYAAPLFDERGRVRGAVGANLDISARVLAERQRDLLLAGMAHDLKNPLSALVWLAEALHRHPRAPEEAQLLERFVEGTRQILAQINEFVDTTRGQLGRPLELDLRRVDLAALVARLAAEQTGDRCIRVGGAETSLPGLFDEARLARALANVLGNALKYSSPREEVVVTLSRAEGATGSWATIRVADRGIGIPAAEVGRVFEPYYRASNARPGRDGSGLGLAGVRQVVEAHGGSVSLESEEGVGTTVTLRLAAPAPRVAG